MIKTETFKVRLLPNAGPPNSTIYALGRTGCGKTTLIGNILLGRKRFVVIDLKNDYTVSFFPGAVECSDPQVLATMLNSGKERIIFRMSMADLDPQKVSNVCAYVMAFHAANPKFVGTFCMDELNAVCTPQTCPPGLRMMITSGRSIGIQKIFGGQWFNHLPPFARDSFSEIYVFQHNDHRGLTMLEVFGFNPGIVSSLPPYTCCHSNGGEVKIIKIQAYGKSS